MNHKRGKPKAQRSGCLLCKPQKLNAHKTADRSQERVNWEEYEDAAELDGVGHARIRYRGAY